MTRFHLTFALFTFGFFPQSGFSENNPSPKYGAWGVSLSLNQKRLDGTSVHGERGQSLQVGLSWATLRDIWYFAGQGETQLGPYASPTVEKTKTDFFGTSFELTSGVQIWGDGFRSLKGGVGLGAALKYSDEVGRSVGSPKISSEGRYIETYELSIRGLYVSPSLFYARLLPSRSRGNEPKHLMTRLEGFQVALGSDLPILATYNARYQIRNIETVTFVESEKASGSLKGYTVFLRITTYLGI